MDRSSRVPDWTTFLRWRDFIPAFRRYNNYSDRSSMALEHYQELLEGDVLDVCCGSSAPYYRAVLGTRYKGLDISDSYKYDDLRESPDAASHRPDFVCNVERENLPF